jgi:hypothetical protein
MAKEEWKLEAKCLNLDTNMFFDKYEEDVDLRPAIDSLCQSCPVQRQCLANAVSRQEWGVWGGVYFEKGKISKEFNNHKDKDKWFNVWSAITMEKK